MRRRFLAVCTTALSCLIVHAGVAGAQQTFDQPYEGARSPRNASYDLSVRLDPAAHTLHGIGLIRWRNISDRFTRELWMHVPREATVTSMAAVVPGSNETSLATPPTGSTRVPLPFEVGPFEEIEVHVEWRTRLREAGALSMIRWFPKVAVLDDAGWRTDAVYADFGSYDVQVTVPPRLRVSASGDEVLRLENPDGSITYRYRADDVRDFTWSASSTRPGPGPWPLVPLAQAVVSAALLLAGRCAPAARGCSALR